MASIKVRFRESTNSGKEGTIYYQLIHNKTVKQLNTKYKIFTQEWDNKSANVIVCQINNGRQKYLNMIRDRINMELIRLQQIISLLMTKGDDFTVNDIITNFEKQLQGESLLSFMQSIISCLRELRKERTAETYVATLNSFMRFRKGEDLLICDISSEIMMSYQAYLQHQGLSMNTISFYMRILRAVYNRAVEKELIEQRYPFKRVYTGISKTVKRALPIKSIKQIKELDLTLQPRLEFARDLFLFSFYTRGMSFVDMAYLRRSDIKNGVLSYRRRKTGQQLHIKWESCMQKIVDKHQNNNTQYILPIIKSDLKDDRLQYKSALFSVNNYLKQIAANLGISHSLTMYVARHSWASVAKTKNIPISVISEGMGHDSEATTQIYLASLDTSVVDKANSSIIKLLL